MTSVALQKPHVRYFLAISSITLAMLVLPIAFTDEKAARVIFYWCGYCSLAGKLYEVFATLFLLHTSQISRWSLWTRRYP